MGRFVLRFLLPLVWIGIIYNDYGLAAERGVPNVKKVMVIIFENTDFSDAMSQPFFSHIAQQGALLTEMVAEAHPSQSNYVALTAGETAGVQDDHEVTVDVRHIGDLLEEKGKTWKVYAENFPGHCFLGMQKGSYVRKHVPFLSYQNVQENQSRCGRIVEASELNNDIRDGSLPDYSFYVPNLKNDGHDTGVAYADKWFERTFGPLLSDSRFMKDLLLVVTFDEGRKSGDNHIYTSFYGNMVVPGSHFDAPVDHYTILHTIEESLGLDTLGQRDANARIVTGIWQ